MLKLHFHGHSCWSFDDGSHRLLVDPFLTGNPRADVGPEAFDALDAIVITHGHSDHIGDAVEISRATGAQVISNYEIAGWCEKRGSRVHPMHIGGGCKFEFGHVKFTIAHHGSTGPDGESLGNPMGVVLTMSGHRVYHAGDTGLFLDMRLIAEMNGPLDVALLPIGDNFTMGVRDAVKAAEFLDAKMTLPMHYNTFGLIMADASEFVDQIKRQGRHALALEPGEEYTID